MTEIVARSEARFNGRCYLCNTLILKGNVVFKMATEGETTPQGNGPGHWVCGPCAFKVDDELLNR
jgi:hypothetical protein